MHRIRRKTIAARSNSVIAFVVSSLLVTASFFSGGAYAQATTWTPIGPRGASVIAMTRVPGSPGHVYACTFSGGIYESVDGGMSWSQLPAPFSNQYIFDVAIDPSTPGTLYVGSFESGVYLSTDWGLTWSTVNDGLTDLSVHDIEFIPATGTLLAATTKGVFYSTNAGVTWSLGSSGVDQLFGSGLFIDPLNSSAAYALTTGQGIYRSLDDGQTWTPLTNGLLTEGINDLHLDVRDQSWIYAATSSSIYRIPYIDFENDTGSWENIGFNLDETPIHQALTLPNTNILVPVATGVYEFNGTDSWNLWADIPSRLLFATVDGGIIHVAGELDVLAMTADQGTTFFPANWGIQNRFVGALETVNVYGWTLVYGGTDKGVELTSEFFRTGDTLPWLLSRNFDGAIFDLAIASNSPETFYVGTERDGVWKALAFGGQWEPISNGIVPNRINALSQSRTGSQVLYAGTSAGLFLSNDQGASWTNEGNTVNPRDVTAVATHSESDLIAYYGTRAGQIYQTFNGGSNFQLAWPGIGEAITDITIAPFFNIYAVMESGALYASTDGGFNFFPLAAIAGEQVMGVAVDPLRPWNAYAATKTGGVQKTTELGLNWSPANNGITNMGIFCIDIAYANENLVYAGSADVVFKTTDGAQTWVPVDTGLPSGKVTRIQISDDDNLVVYATIEETSVYRTIDGGTSWNLFYEELDNATALPLLQDEALPNVMYAGSLTHGVQKSTDGGTTWAGSSEGMRLFVRTVATSWEEPDTVYAGSLSDGLFKTVDGGGIWTPMGLEDRNIFKVAIDPNASNTVYVGDSLGIARSTDGGTNWQDLGQLNEFYFDIIVDSADPNRIYGSGLGGVIVRTEDNGQTWNRINEGIPLVNILAIARDESTQVLYAAPEFEGICRSEDDGITWIDTGTDLLTYQITTLFVAQNGDLYAGTQAHGVFRSSDAGDTFAALAIPVGSDYVADVVSPAINPNLVLVATRSGMMGVESVYRSLDGGTTWAAASDGITDMGILTFAFNSDESIVYAASLDSLYRSTNDATTWDWVSDITATPDVTSLVVDSVDATVLFAGTNTSGVLKSTDAGQTWSPTVGTNGLAIGKLAHGAGGSLLAGTFGIGMIRSDDAGLTWSMGANPELLNSLVLDVAVNPADSNILYVATGGTGVHKSIDAGVNWFPVNTGLDHLGLLTLLLDPLEPDTLYVGTSQGGVYQTKDGGATWTPINNGLFNLTVTSLALDANDHTILYAGTEGGGVFQIDL